MTGIFIAANHEDKKMWSIFPAILKNYFPIVLGAKNQQELPAEPHCLLLEDIKNAAIANPDEAILIIKELDGIPCGFPAGEDTVAIVDSSAETGVQLQVSEIMVPAITCGMSPKDTVTISSISGKDVVVTLQRTVRCFDGTVAEPQEIPVKLRSTSDAFTIMSSLVVLLLTGKVNSMDTIAL